MRLFALRLYEIVVSGYQGSDVLRLAFQNILDLLKAKALRHKVKNLISTFNPAFSLTFNSAFSHSCFLGKVYLRPTIPVSSNSNHIIKILLRSKIRNFSYAKYPVKQISSKLVRLLIKFMSMAKGKKKLVPKAVALVKALGEPRQANENKVAEIKPDFGLDLVGECQRVDYTSHFSTFPLCLLEQ